MVVAISHQLGFTLRQGTVNQLGDKHYPAFPTQLKSYLVPRLASTAVAMSQLAVFVEGQRKLENKCNSVCQQTTQSLEGYISGVKRHNIALEL